MICPNCDNYFDDDYSFCPHCGEEKPEPLTCPNCGFKSNDYSFCPNCGEKILNKDELEKYRGDEEERKQKAMEIEKEMEMQREIEREKIWMKEFIEEGYFSTREKNELINKVNSGEISMNELEEMCEHNENKLSKIANEHCGGSIHGYKWCEDGFWFYGVHGDYTLTETELLDWYEENLGLRYFD